MNLAELTKLTEDEAREYFEKIMWTKGVICPHCGSKKAWKNTGKTARAGLYDCADCKKQFTVTVGTIMEGSHIPLRKWAMAFHLLCSSKKGMSASQLKRELGLGSYETALFMTQRIREAMNQKSVQKMLKGKVEVDEAYVGGKPRHGTGKHKRGRGTKKQPVLAIVSRDGSVHTRVITNVTAKTLHGAIEEMVGKNATIITDEWKGYNGIGKKFKGGHKTVNHGKKEYARGEINTNTAESYFAIMKRGINGIYHSVSKKHLHRYCNEYSFRWNHKDISDGERMIEAVKSSKGKRLIYKQVVARKRHVRKIAA